MIERTGVCRDREDMLTCCLCFELYNTTQQVPKALPCQHTFCVPCLDKCIQTADDIGQEHKCPICKGMFVLPHQGACDLPTNFTVMDMLELNVLEEISSKERNSSEQEHPMCDIHIDKRSMFVCVDCIAGLCAECIITLSKGAHREHTLQEIETVFTEQKLSLDDFKANIDALDIHITNTHKIFKNRLQNKHNYLCKKVDKNAKIAIKHLSSSSHPHKRMYAKMNEWVKISQQQIRIWQQNRKTEIKEGLDSKQAVLIIDITDLLNQRDDIKSKIRHTETLLKCEKLSSIKLTKTLTAALQTLEIQHQELKENTSRWELAVNTQCDVDLPVADPGLTCEQCKKPKTM